VKIVKMVDQHRRDFRADMVCEGCGSEEKNVGGYDDRNFHDNVIPAMKCKKCGESRNSLGLVDEPTPTKYGDYEVV
jgi:hypothetical protein